MPTMGDRGYNAGGFAYMEIVTCPRCGARRPLGWKKIKEGHLECDSREKCDKRREGGRYLHRLSKEGKDS